MDILADESERLIAKHGAWQEPGLEQDLKAVADAQYHPAMAGKLLHRPHDRRESGNGPCPQIIAVGKAAGQNDCIQAVEGCLLVPDFLNLLAKNVGEHMHAVVIAVGTREYNYSEIHVLAISYTPYAICS